MNRLNMDSFFGCDIKEYEVRKRGTGTTTGLILKCIGEASCRKGDSIEFIDHFKVDSVKAIWLKSMIKDIASNLSLSINVEIDNCRIFIKSTKE